MVLEIKEKVDWSKIQKSKNPCTLFAWHFECWVDMRTFKKWDSNLNPLTFDEAIALIRTKTYIDESRLGLLDKGEQECLFLYLEGHFSGDAECYFMDLHYRFNDMLDPFDKPW